jgi:Flp pilus assembly protein TadB
MFDNLLEVQRMHPGEDELLNQYLIVGLCKAAAIVGMVSITHSATFIQISIIILFHVCVAVWENPSEVTRPQF